MVLLGPRGGSLLREEEMDALHPMLKARGRAGGSLKSSQTFVLLHNL